MKIDPQIAYGLGQQICISLKQIPKIPAMETPENETDLLDFIKSNYRIKAPKAPNYRKTPLTFRTQINSDFVLVRLSNTEYESAVLRIHNSFSSVAGSKNTTLWTKYDSDGSAGTNLDTKQKCSKQIAEITLLFALLNTQIEKILDARD